MPNACLQLACFRRVKMSLTRNYVNVRNATTLLPTSKKVLTLHCGTRTIEKTNYVV
jgi:hypothetical protein